MPAELFVDTSAWFTLAAGPTADRDRVERGLRERVRARVRVVTSNLVVAETHALLLRRAGCSPALAFVREVARAPTVVVSSSLDLERRAVTEWLERYHDQDFSYTDAISFAVMAERGIREALTIDRHFAAAGFVMVPGR